MEKLFIKKAAIKDIPLIIELASHVWPQTYTHVIGPEQVAYMLSLYYSPAALLQQMEEMEHSFIICWSGDAPVAFASWSRTAHHIYKLHKIYILPGYQGRGIGLFIIGHITKILKESNAKSLLLNVNRYNYPAIAFYEKLGFELLRNEDIDIGNGYFMNDYVLGLDIN